MEEQVLTYLYSLNKLTNGGAETGDLTGWDSNGVTVVDGGTIMPPAETGLKCFQFVSNPSYALMTQSKSGAVVSPQPPDYKVAFDYLPLYEQLVADPKNYAYVEVGLTYADDYDQVIIPCRKDVKQLGGGA